MTTNKQTYTEEELLYGIRKRDNRVIEFIIREYRPTIRLLIIRMGGSWADAKDVFQEALIDLIRITDDPSFLPRSSIKTLIYAICKNRFRNSLRRNKKEVLTDLEKFGLIIEPDFSEPGDMDLYEELFWGIFKTLPRSCRKLLELHFSEHSNREISMILNQSVAYIRKRKSLCTRTMIDRIKGHIDYKRLIS